MYYELYVDVLFLENFMMDVLLLWLVKKALKREVSKIRPILGAAAGAGLVCLLILLQIPYIVRFILFYLLVSTVMLVIGLKIRTVRDYIKALVLLYAGAFLLGGVMGYVRQYVRVGSLFFFLALPAYYAVSGIWDFCTRHQRYEAYHVSVRLFCAGEEIQVTALFDTGNSLYDPLLKKPVSVLERSAAEALLKKRDLPSWYISYQTVNRKDGILPVVRLDKMYIGGEKKTWIEAPVIALCDEPISGQGEYRMILNPNLC